MSQNSALPEVYGSCLIQKWDKTLFKAKRPYKATVPVNNPQSKAFPSPQLPAEQLGTFSQASFPCKCLLYLCSSQTPSPQRIMYSLTFLWLLFPVWFPDSPWSSLLHLLSPLFPEWVSCIFPEKSRKFPFPFCSHIYHLADLTLLVSPAEGMVPTSDVTLQRQEKTEISFPTRSGEVGTLSSRRSWLCPTRDVLKRLTYARKKLANQCFLKDIFCVTLQKDSAWLFLSLLNIEIAPKEKYSKGQTHQKSKFFIDCNKPNLYSKSQTVHLPSSVQCINQCY